MTEWKSKVPYSFLSQSSIAALKDVFSYGRLMSSHPLLPPSPSGAPTDHSYTHYPYTYWGGLWGARGSSGGGGRGEGEQSSSISHLVRNSGASSALTRVVPYSSSFYTVFHSVIYNSVGSDKLVNLLKGAVLRDN